MVHEGGIKRPGRRTISLGSTLGTGGMVILLCLVFIVAVKWFRTKPVEDKPLVPSLENILTPDPISQSVLDATKDAQSHEARLQWVSTGAYVGTAIRGEKDGKSYIELTASLPEIDREKMYYQVWLLRQLPYDFFSLGKMVTNEEGVFTLAWQALDSEDYLGYSQIIVTVNPFDGSADPGEHLVEGAF